MRCLAAAVLMIVAGPVIATADTWPVPRTISFAADWQAARAALPLIPDANPTDPTATVTSLAVERFPAVANSPVPVLLPYALGDDDSIARRTTSTRSRPICPISRPRNFFAGPTGYDATFALRTQDVPAFSDIDYRDPVVVQISAFNMLYELPEAKGVTVWRRATLPRNSPASGGKSSNTRCAIASSGSASAMWCRSSASIHRNAAPASPAAMPTGSRCVFCARCAWSAATRTRPSQPCLRRLSKGPLRFGCVPLPWRWQARCRFGHARTSRQLDDTVYAESVSRRRGAGLCQHADLSKARRPRDCVGAAAPQMRRTHGKQTICLARQFLRTPRFRRRTMPVRPRPSGSGYSRPHLRARPAQARLSGEP